MPLIGSIETLHVPPNVAKNGDSTGVAELMKSAASPVLVIVTISYLNSPTGVGANAIAVGETLKTGPPTAALRRAALVVNMINIVIIAAATVRFHSRVMATFLWM